MRENITFFFIFIFSTFTLCIPSPPHPATVRPVDGLAVNHGLKHSFLYELLLLIFFLVLLLFDIASTFVNETRYITFDTCLDFLPHCGKTPSARQPWYYLYSIGLPIVYLSFVDAHLYFALSETLHEIITPYFFKFLKVYSGIYVTMFLNSVYILKLLFPNPSPYLRVVFFWFLSLILLLSSDIETLPGPNPTNNSILSPQEGAFKSGFFSFCNWNLNTLSKNDFHRVSLLQAHNSYHKYDIISLCETSLNETTQVPENILPGYNFFSLDHPSGEKKGGVGVFYKEVLPLKIRLDLS